MEKKIPLKRLRNFFVEAVSAVGVGKENAKIIAESLIVAEMRGIKSHGAIRLSSYMRRIESGVMDPKATGNFLKDEGATALLDAENGFGQIAGYRAMHHAIQKARFYGIGLVGVRNSNHFGIASYYSMMAANENMLGIVMTNSSPAMNPFGTSSPLLGTNPISLAVPAEKEKPIVLDMSTSLVARGKIRFAALTGKQIPLGWATDSNGNPTTDANEAIKGSLEPIGGAKGSGLSLIVDIFCGILTNSCLTGDVKTIADVSGQAHTGHVFGAVNISSFISSDMFKQNIDAVIKRIKALPSKGQEVFLPGEIEFNLTAEREKEGIPLDYAVIEELDGLADRYNISRL